MDLVRFRRRHFCGRLCGRCLLDLDGRLLLGSYLVTLDEAGSSYTEEDDDGDKRPCGFLKEIRSTRRTHHLVATGKACGKATSLTVLNQHKERQQDSCNNDKNSNKYVHSYLIYDL